MTENTRRTRGNRGLPIANLKNLMIFSFTSKDNCLILYIKLGVNFTDLYEAMFKVNQVCEKWTDFNKGGNDLNI